MKPGCRVFPVRLPLRDGDRPEKNREASVARRWTVYCLTRNSRPNRPADFPKKLAVPLLEVPRRKRAQADIRGSSYAA